MKTFKQMILRQLGDELLAIRRSKGLSQQDVSLQTDLSLKSINDLENGVLQGYTKYRRLLYFYRKELKMLVVDR